jgi:predicted nucleic acid-binding protein
VAIDRSTLLFFDASCLLAVAGSPQGGSGFLLELCQRNLLRAAVSQPVLLETERNLAKLSDPDAAALAFFGVLAQTPFVIAPIPFERDILRYMASVGEKDEHVLAAAVACGAEFLVTLDKAFATAADAGKFGLRAVSPGEFIKTHLPLHPDFAGIR